MIWFSILAAIAVAYLVGSFPSGYLVGRLWGVDVRRAGSGRTGGTNVYRAAGIAAALLTGALDIGKGALAVWLAGLVTGQAGGQVLAGTAAIVGHIHPLFLRFRGGAGVGTSLGALAALYLPAAVGLAALLLILIAVTRYASVGSLVVCTLMPFLLLILGETGTVPLIYVAYGCLAWAIIVYAHLPNIQRLLAGTERRLGGSSPRRPSV